MAATRPGNPDRGWNDPPMFMYSSDTQQGQSSSRKNPLTQRVGMPQSYVRATPTTASTNQSSTKTVSHGAPPTRTSPHVQVFSHPPPVDISTSSPARSSEVQVEDQSKLLPDDICEASLAKLRGVLEECGEKLKARVSDDIKKRIEILNSAWENGKLSTVVQQRMASLSTALAQRQYDKAHDVHLSLMVDFVSEVGQWMVGIKRLIAEARTILPSPPPPSEDSEEIDSNNVEAAKEETEKLGETNNGLLPVPAPPCSSSETTDEDGRQVPSDKETAQDEPEQSVSKDEQGELKAAKGEIQHPAGSETQPILPDSLPLAKTDSEENSTGSRQESMKPDKTDEADHILNQSPDAAEQPDESGRRDDIPDSGGLSHDEPALKHEMDRATDDAAETSNH